MPSKILIADDSLKIQKELTQLLKGAGVEVVTVSNGEHAVRKLPTVQPDLVLADIFMPVRSGYEVCSYIKSTDEFAHIGVLLLASKMEPYDEKEAQRVRADGKLEKPFADSAAVLATIQQHLEKALSRKPAPAAPPIAEFAAAVAPAPEPEPEPEPVSTKPPPLTFDTQAPMGFTDVEEAPAAVPIEEPPAPPAPAAEAPPAEEPLPATIAGFEPPPAPGEKTVIAKPELAAPWEMTGPEPGAPEIPAAGGWESQWTGREEVPTEAATEAAPAEEAPAPATEAPPERPYAPEEFAAAFAGPSAPAAAEPALDPAVVDQVVNQVLERLTPQVMDTIAREIVRPLAESLIREKLKG